MATYGYIRKDSTQVLMDQLMCLFPYGCDKLYIEEKSIAETKELEQCLVSLENHDTLVVVNLPSFGQRLDSKLIQQLFSTLKRKQVRFISLDEQLDTKTDKLFVAHCCLFLETDHLVQKNRRQQLIDSGAYRQVSYGRPTIKEEKSIKIRDLYLQKKTLREISELCEVSLGTAHKYVKLFKAELMSKKNDGELSLSSEN